MVVETDDIAMLKVALAAAWVLEMAWLGGRSFDVMACMRMDFAYYDVEWPQV